MRQEGILSRAVAVVEYVARTGRPVSVGELVRTLELPKPSAHRICGTLEEMGVLVRDPVARAMAIGPRLSRLALDTMLASADYGGRRRVLRSVVEEAGETCTLTVQDGDEVLILDRVESSSPLQVQLYPGSRVPLHCTASGKLILAFLPKSKRSRLIGSVPLKRHTANTLTDARDLERALQRIKREKVSKDNEEFLPGLAAIAVPIIDNQRRMCATISLNGPASRLKLTDIDKQLRVLRSAAESLALFFGRSAKTRVR